MKNKLIVVALIAVILAGGMVLLGCESNCPGDGKCDLWDLSLSACYYKSSNDKTVYDCMPGALSTKCEC